MKTTRLAAVCASALALSLAPAAGAHAAPTGDPSTTRTANPAQSCASIPGTLAQFGLEAPGFRYSSCVKTLSGRVPDLPFGSPYAQCAALEAGIDTPGGTLQIRYPFVFHAGEGDPFPDLKATNREQCARALWTFHTIESLFPAPPA